MAGEIVDADELEDDEIDVQRRIELASARDSSYANDADSRPLRQLGAVQFNMKEEDFDQDWFHVEASRDSAVLALHGSADGTFLVRPSWTQKGCYAISWYDKPADKVRHSLVHGLYPGYALDGSTTLRQRYWSLSSLISDCPFLKHACAKRLDATSKSVHAEERVKTSLEVVGLLAEKLEANDRSLTSLSWRLVVLDSPENFTNCEKRTFVDYCQEDYVAPLLLPLQGDRIKLIAETLARNTTLTTLQINGYEGHLRRTFSHNLMCADASLLASALAVNHSLTVIDLSVNRIGDDGAETIARALCVNSRVASVNLSRNFIGERGLLALARVLLSNTSLSSFDVSNQLVESKLGGVSLAYGDGVRSCVRLITDTVHRRQELLGNPCQPRLPAFFGCRTRSQVDAHLARARTGTYLFYLDPKLPNVVVVAHVVRARQRCASAVATSTTTTGASTAIRSPPLDRLDCSLSTSGSSSGSSPSVTPASPVHSTSSPHLLFASSSPPSSHQLAASTPTTTPTPSNTSAPFSMPVIEHARIHRSANGYTFSRQGVPSLFDMVAWRVSTDPNLLRRCETQMPDDVVERLHATRNLLCLWGIRQVPPTPAQLSAGHVGGASISLVYEEGVYPTLTYLLQRNKAALQHPSRQDTADL